MAFISNYKTQWFHNVRGDILSGTVVALALIPEAIAFSLIAGVDPKVGLYAAFSIAVLTAFFGGRPAMISAATAATAVLMVGLVRDHGLEYLLAATILAGILQILIGILGLARLMRFVSKSVMTGFINALAIMIFLAQLPELDPNTQGVGPITWGLVAFGMAIIYLAPRLTKSLPAPLIAIIMLTSLVAVMGLDVRTVGDMGALPENLPIFLLPDVALNLETITIILPYSAAIAVVGLLESLMTQSLMDEQTDMVTSRDQECIGQGIANTATGFIGGMAGCAMIGQSMINLRSGGSGRLSSFTAGALLLTLVVGLGDYVAQIPMPALVAVMLVVTIGTFDWGSIVNLHRTPRASALVMLSTVAMVLWTHNLALGVVLGAVMSGLFFAAKVADRFRVTSELSQDGQSRLYRIEGGIFYASAENLAASFDFQEKLNHVTIDFTNAQIYDITANHALQQVQAKFLARGIHATLIGTPFTAVK